MEFDHTPGPWFFDPTDGTIWFNEADPITLFEQVDGGDMADPEQLSADGYCAAAAPFMLNTLSDIASLDLEDIPDLTREQILAWVQTRANEAIAKATGGPHA